MARQDVLHQQRRQRRADIHHHFQPLRRQAGSAHHGQAQLTTDNNGLLWDSATYNTSPSGRAHATGPASQSSADPAPAATVFPGLTKGDSREQTSPRPSEIVTTDITSYLYAYMLKPASAPRRRRRRLCHDKPCDECGNIFELYDAMVGQDPIMYCEDCWFGLFE